MVKCHPAGQEHGKRGSSLPPPPALFQGLDLSNLYTQAIAQVLALEWLPQTLPAPNIQCELGELRVLVIPPMPFACVVSFRGTDMMRLFPHNYQSWVCGGKYHHLSDAPSTPQVEASQL